MKLGIRNGKLTGCEFAEEVVLTMREHILVDEFSAGVMAKALKGFVKAGNFFLKNGHLVFQRDDSSVGYAIESALETFAECCGAWCAKRPYSLMMISDSNDGTNIFMTGSELCVAPARKKEKA